MLRPKTVNKTKDIKTGSVLMAKPFWNENLYKKSVILITSHDKEGSEGLILNKESNLNIQLMLKGMSIALPVLYGGPMDKNAIACLHKMPLKGEQTGTEPMGKN